MQVLNHDMYNILPTAKISRHIDATDHSTDIILKKLSFSMAVSSNYSLHYSIVSRYIVSSHNFSTPDAGFGSE